ncbi:MAG: hypothetical protein ACI9HK_005196 [Pirellulaceae bacterium]
MFDFTGFSNNFGQGVQYPTAFAGRNAIAERLIDDLVIDDLVIDDLVIDDLALEDVDNEAQDQALMELLNDWNKGS